jgi:hypothetical protein
MSPAHLHLLLNHLPVIGTIVTIALLAWALLRRSLETTRASFGMFVVFALLGLAVYLTGEPAEHLVEDLAGVSHDAVEAHEEAALLATVLLGGLGALALGGLVAFRRAAAIPRGFAALVLALSLAPAAAMGWTANLGGKIRHPEIGPASAPAAEGDRVERSGAPAGDAGPEVLALVGLGVAGAESHRSTRTSQHAAAGPRIPEAMRVEHAEIHEALVAATRAPGRVGDAAREVARVLDPHFEREEQIALPPLGLLPALARGDEVTDAMAAVLPLTDSLEAELPQMLQEHQRISAALDRLAAAAREEGQPKYAALAEQIQLHARMEEQVTYPAAIVIGKLIRLKRGG